MTYGWAILIIAVVLGALFELGLFNSANLAPKSPPGSCQVLRPNGPGSTSYINLEGVCNNGLPQYVAQFNGQNSNVTTLLPTTAVASVSLFEWVYVPSLSEKGAFIEVGNSGTPTTPLYGYGIWVGSGNGGVAGNGLLGLFSWVRWINCNTNIGIGWHFVGLVLGSNGVPSCYLDGMLTATVPGSNAIAPISTMYIGSASDAGNSFNGLIANLQVYNTSLSANEITALYDEGIGGVPLNLNSLVGWWPLNSNANDYSGNLNNGVPTNIVYTNSWTSGYSAP